MNRNTGTYKWDWWILGFYFGIAVLAPFLAGNKALLCISNHGIAIPAAAGNHTLEVGSKCATGWQWLPLLAYDPGDIDREAMGKPPGTVGYDGSWRTRHWLGTDKLGRDVASGMIHGTTLALIIGFFSVFLAFLIGVSLGMGAAYTRHARPQINVWQFVLFLTGLFLIWFYFSGHWKVNTAYILPGLSILLLVSWTILHFFLARKWQRGRRIHIPVDDLLVKAIEIRKSLPGLLIILSLSMILQSPGIWHIAFLVAMLSFLEFARFARAETLSVMQENYIKSLQLAGIPYATILWKHILPNILPTLAGVTSFSTAGAVLLESSLSFLGVGLPVEQVSWGQMLADGRDMRHWWLVVWPGISLFLLVLSLNKSAERLLAKSTPPVL